MNVRISRHLKELVWAIDKWLWVISNKMLFKTVIPLGPGLLCQHNFEHNRSLIAIIGKT